MLLSAVLFTGAIGLFLWILIRWLLKYIQIVRSIKLPTPHWLPLIGNAHLFNPNQAEQFTHFVSYAKQFDQEGVYVLWIGPLPLIVIHKAELLEELMNSTKHIEKSKTYDALLPWLGRSLLTSTGEKWKTRRKLLTPAFHFQILNDFLEVICEQGGVMVSKLNEMAEKGHEFNIYPYLAHCALDIICETAMGERIGAQEECNSDYVNAVYKMSEVVAVRSMTPWHASDFIYSLSSAGREHDRLLKILHGFTDSVIKKRLAEQKVERQEEKQETVTTKKKRMALLDLLLHESEEVNGTLTQTDIREEVDTFMFEGHDTTATGMGWACYLIGAHPEVQQRLHEEVDDIFGDSNRHATMDDLTRMNYLECVIKEMLRVFPPVPFVGRVTSEPFSINGCDIPVGTNVGVFKYSLHRDERFFPDPDKFDPDRFSQDEASNRHPFAYIPFSAGPRNCIGQKFAMMEMKVELSSMLRKYRIESTQTPEQLRPQSNLVLRPENGIRVRLRRRVPAQ